jgi:hypothetical protein
MNIKSGRLMSGNRYFGLVSHPLHFSQHRSDLHSENTQEAYNPECLVPTMIYGGRSVTIWAAISWYSGDPVIILNGRITPGGYIDILGNQELPMVQILFPNNDAVFQDDNSPMNTARSVQFWFEEHED